MTEPEIDRVEYALGHLDDGRRFVTRTIHWTLTDEDRASRCVKHTSREAVFEGETGFANLLQHAEFADR